jgi:hypothetical protein
LNPVSRIMGCRGRLRGAEGSTRDWPSGRPTPGAISNFSPAFMTRPECDAVGRAVAAANFEERRARGADAGAKAAAEAAMAMSRNARCMFLRVAESARTF